MKKELHKVRGNQMTQVSISSNQYESKVYMIADSPLLEENKDESIAIKLDYKMLQKLIKEGNAIFHIRKARTWWHVEDVSFEDN